MTRASVLVGANPRGALAELSLAVRAHLHALVDARTHLLVACSGGPDSMGLALAVADLAAREGRPFSAHTVDHGLREGSREEAEHVAGWLRDLGFARATVSSLTLSRAGAGPEGDARAARYEALAAEARAVAGGGPVAVLTGHTADDQAETVLLGLARGSGARSLDAMGSGLDGRQIIAGVEVHRPLLGVRRARLREALTDAGLAWVDDPTNRASGPWRAADGSSLRRAAVREVAIPALAAALGVDPVPALVRTADLLRRDDEALTVWADDVYMRALVAGEEVRLAVDSLIGLPEAVLARVLRRASLESGVPSGGLARAHLDAAARLVTDWHGQGPLALPGGITLTRDSDVRVLAWRGVYSGKSV